MLSGAGLLSAYDIRTPNASNHLGGIYQSASYIAGISGGLWIVTNNLMNDGRPIVDAMEEQMEYLGTPLLEGVPDVDVDLIKDRLDGDRVATVPSKKSWNTTLTPKGSLAATLLASFFTKSNETDTTVSPSAFRRVLDFYKDLNIEVRAKSESQYRISLTDYWGRALARKILPKSKRQMGFTMTSASKLPSVQNHLQPFPIFVSVERQPGLAEDSRSSHIFEFNLFEFGSWDSFLNSFVKIKYLGSNLQKGIPKLPSLATNYSVCVAGYDNLAMITATSSSLFNALFQYVYKMLANAEQQSSMLVSQILHIFGVGYTSVSGGVPHKEYAVYSPNPFYGTDCAELGRCVSKARSLYLADGGDDGQNIPFGSLLVRQRQVDLIFAFDATADLANFPNGTTLRRTASRYHAKGRVPVFEHAKVKRTIFPRVPSAAEYVLQQLNSRPVFLGCEMADYPPTNTTHDSADVWHDYTPPIIIYHANHDFSYASNTLTFQASYAPDEVRLMMTNGYNIATFGNDTEFRTCVGCAMTKRSLDRQNAQVPPVCLRCFQRFCYK